jgi:hypothetical protein
MELEEWRKRREEGEPFQLDSGLVIYIRNVTLMDLAAQGDIPVPLMGQAGSVAQGFRTGDLEKVKDTIPLVNLVVKAAVVRPRIEDEPGPGVLGIGELTVAERLSIFGRASRIGSLTPFRQEPASTEGD